MPEGVISVVISVVTSVVTSVVISVAATLPHHALSGARAP